MANLPFSAQEQDIRDFFAPLIVGNVKIPIDRESGRPRGFAFADIELGDKSVESVIAAHDGQPFGGRAIRVNLANEKPKTQKRAGDTSYGW